MFFIEGFGEIHVDLRGGDGESYFSGGYGEKDLTGLNNVLIGSIFFPLYVVKF